MKSVIEGEVQSVSMKVIKKFLDENGYSDVIIESIYPAKIEYEKTNCCIDEVKHVEVLNTDNYYLLNDRLLIYRIECIFNNLTCSMLQFHSIDPRQFVHFIQCKYGFNESINNVSVVDMKYALEHNDFEWIKCLFEQVDDAGLLRIYDKMYNKRYIETWELDCNNNFPEMRNMLIKEMSKRNLSHKEDIEL